MAMTDTPELFESVLGSGAGGPLTAPTPWVQFTGYVQYLNGVVVGVPTGLNKGNGTINAPAIYVNGVQILPANYTPLAGGTMTGPLILSADPTVPLGATTKQYSDTKVPLAGGTMTGLLVLSADPGTNLGAATKQYVDTKAALYLPLAGGTMTGMITLPATTPTALQATTKNYVDGQVSPVSANFANYLPLVGGTVTGPIVLPADPTVNLQAATKHYVDQQFSGLIAIPDAPADGSTYGRNNNAWTNVHDAGTY